MKEILTFKTEDILIDKITDLKIEGITEDQLKIIAKKEITDDFFNTFSGKIEKANVKSGIAKIFSGGYPTPDLERYGIDEKDRIDYENELNNGNYVLIIEKGDL